ncbi:hypothetical protein WJX81_003070 [Elliptochloris bilobata]|uniref:DinB-like domain-containing protein n=1 Tax=Elliptochloris bilobata TaxID=381761 RepID=A0AAW1RWM6_9CHLO
MLGRQDLLSRDTLKSLKKGIDALSDSASLRDTAAGRALADALEAMLAFASSAHVAAALRCAALMSAAARDALKVAQSALSRERWLLRVVSAAGKLHKTVNAARRRTSGPASAAATAKPSAHRSSSLDSRGFSAGRAPAAHGGMDAALTCGVHSSADKQREPDVGPVVGANEGASPLGDAGARSALRGLKKPRSGEVFALVDIEDSDAEEDALDEALSGFHVPAQQGLSVNPQQPSVAAMHVAASSEQPKNPHGYAVFNWVLSDLKKRVNELPTVNESTTFSSADAAAHPWLATKSGGPVAHGLVHLGEHVALIERRLERRAYAAPAAAAL